ncbi:MAG: LON peptidase substrate-binding domain-containing protein [Opitutaceae bacterium]
MDIQEIEIPREVPIMTLGNTVLFPQAMMPLYIFEPRYREMLSKVLAEDRIFAIAALDEAEEYAEVLETPHKVASVGLVRACKQNPDGTSNLILQGLARIEMDEIVSEEPYRTARIHQLISEPGGSKQAVDSIHTGILNLLKIQRRLGADLPIEVIRFLDNIKDPENMLDLAIYTLCTSSKLKQKLLETRGIVPRYDRFRQFLFAEIEQLKLDQKLKGGLDPDDIGSN